MIYESVTFKSGNLFFKLIPDENSWVQVAFFFNKYEAKELKATTAPIPATTGRATTEVPIATTVAYREPATNADPLAKILPAPRTAK